MARNTRPRWGHRKPGLRAIRHSSHQRAGVQAIRLPRKKASGRVRLAHLLDEQAEEEPLVDLVVFDEAHYMRNPESSVHRLGEMLQKVSQQRVLLSATPINLHNDDLFHLLQLCDPEHFQYPSSFQELLLANQPLVSARDAALNPSSNAEEILTYVKCAADTDLLRNSRQLAALLGATNG